MAASTRFRLTSVVRRFFRQTHGQDLIEYGVLIALIAAVVIVAINGLGVKVPGMYSTAAQNLPGGAPGDTGGPGSGNDPGNGNPGNGNPGNGNPGNGNPGGGNGNPGNGNPGGGNGNPGNGNPGNGNPVGNPGENPGRGGSKQGN